jgi:tetratricopeptide (TPR) repeat protein
MKTARNAPCPCGSGRKYKKCCLMQDAKAAWEKRGQPDGQCAAGPVDPDAKFLAYANDLDELSNQANDFIRSKQWEQAEACCQQLLERFPLQIDGHDRFCQYHDARGQFAEARDHAQETLKIAEPDREHFDPEFFTDMAEDIARYEAAIQLDRQAG